jgi:hypothetical protein
MRRIWYPLGYRILHEGRILRPNPQGRVPVGIGVLNEPHEANTGSTTLITATTGPALVSLSPSPSRTATVGGLSS